MELLTKVRSHQEDLLGGLEGMSLAVLTKALGMTKEEVAGLITKARKDLLKGIHTYLPM
jgi:hypothetical protein